MDISNYSKEQLRKMIDRILTKGFDYIIKDQKLYVFSFNYGISVKKEA